MILYETNSKIIKKGQVFVAIKGHTVDGHKYIQEAIENGASKIISEEDLNINIPYEKVLDTNAYLKEHLEKEYSDKLKSLKIIGITGTNGKTTSCYLIYQILKQLGINVAYIGTIGYYHLDEYYTINNTTPDILTLYKLLFHSLLKGATYVVMEISSHSLEEERLKGLHFAAGGFTNLTEEHLDYHKTMEGYLNSKLKIFNYLNDKAPFLVNNDDDYATYFKKGNYQTYGKLGDYKIINYEIKPNYTNLTWQYKNIEYKVKLNLTSLFNIYNYLLCVGILNNLGFKIADIIKVTKDIYPPKGRCETYLKDNNYIVIDYAHTPDALEKVIKSYLEIPHQRIITIFGCGGDRDAYKRPIMGKSATNLSDYVIITNDNPRFEDEKNIVNDIIKGITKNNYEVIFDRKEAIKKGIKLLKDNDILLILGKGHENYQIIKGIKYDLDDALIVKETIKEN